MHSKVTLKDFLTINQYSVINIYAYDRMEMKIPELDEDSPKEMIPPEDWEQYSDYIVSYIGIDDPFAIYVAIEAPTDMEDSSSNVPECAYSDLQSLINQAYSRLDDLEARIKRVEGVELAKPCQGDSND